MYGQLILPQNVANNGVIYEISKTWFYNIQIYKLKKPGQNIALAPMYPKYIFTTFFAPI